ncbi:MAG: hypothetical protein MJZ20_07710 [Bacteroidaceae bacterium]|nr:hypothetical protein [Bacteroidaceae bacterium]
MTISKYISEFIALYSDIKIDTNHIQDGADKYGLFKSPSRQISKNIDGTAIITESYQFFAKEASISETERKESDEFLEDFTYFVDEFGIIYEYPSIDKNRRITDITVSGCPTPFSDEDKQILYQISLSITYEKEIQ